MASVSAIGMASIHLARSNASSNGSHSVTTNSRQVIDSVSGSLSAMMFSGGTPRTSA